MEQDGIGNSVDFSDTEDFEAYLDKQRLESGINGHVESLKGLEWTTASESLPEEPTDDKTTIKAGAINDRISALDAEEISSQLSSSIETDDEEESNQSSDAANASEPTNELLTDADAVSDEDARLAEESRQEIVSDPQLLKKILDANIAENPPNKYSVRRDQSPKDAQNADWVFREVIYRPMTLTEIGLDPELARLNTKSKRFLTLSLDDKIKHLNLIEAKMHHLRTIKNSLVLNIVEEISENPASDKSRRVRGQMSADPARTLREVRRRDTSLRAAPAVKSPEEQKAKKEESKRRREIIMAIEYMLAVADDQMDAIDMTEDKRRKNNKEKLGDVEIFQSLRHETKAGSLIMKSK